MSQKTFASQYGIGDTVFVDNCESLSGKITQIGFRHENEPDYEVSWVHNGDVKYVSLPGWRLSSNASDIKYGFKGAA